MPFTVRGNDLVKVHRALEMVVHMQPILGCTRGNMEDVWVWRNLRHRVFEAMIREREKDAREYEKKHKLGKGTIIKAPRRVKKR